MPTLTSFLYFLSLTHSWRWLALAVLKAILETLFMCYEEQLLNLTEKVDKDVGEYLLLE